VSCAAMGEWHPDNASLSSGLIYAENAIASEPMFSRRA
jgi:hypothetical protein